MTILPTASVLRRVERWPGPDVVRFVLSLMAMMPRATLQLLGGWLGRCHFSFATRTARVTRANLELCMPSTDAPETTEQMVRKSLEETGRTLMETPAVWLGDLTRIDGWIEQVEGEALLTRALASERGLLILLPHLGNWELFNVFFRRYGVMTALYQPPRQPVFRSFMAEVREQHGNHMVPTTRAGLATLYKTLKQGETVVVLPDQVPASGEFVRFFEQDALTDSLTHRLLQKTGAFALMITVTRNDNGRFNVRITSPEDELFDQDVAVSLAALNRMVASAVRTTPAQYQWEYKRFRERPRGQPKLYRFNKPPAIH